MEPNNAKQPVLRTEQQQIGFGYELPVAQKDEWLTPPWMLARLGEFDLDPCSPISRPWDTACEHYSMQDNGLSKPWNGRVWLNPPLESGAAKAWMARLAKHGNGIALLPARTDTRLWADYVWRAARAVCFVIGRITFHHADGRKAARPIGTPIALIAYGPHNAAMLEEAALGPVVTWQRQQ